MRTIIAGGPRTGKTTLSHSFVSSRVLRTDDLISMGWREASDYTAREWLRHPGPWVIEGVAAVRALRKYMAYYPRVKPCDRIYWMTRPHVALTDGQIRMTKGCNTVYAQIKDRLQDLGVEIHER